MPNNPRLYTLDQEADQILTAVPKGKKSSFVSDAVKIKAKIEREQSESKEKPIAVGRVRR